MSGPSGPRRAPRRVVLWPSAGHLSAGIRCLPESYSGSRWRNPPYARSAGPGGPPLPARATIGLYGRDEIFPLFLVADRVILLATPGFLLGLFPGVPGALP